MNSSAPLEPQDAKNLVMKTFIALRCAEHQVAAESSSASLVAELEDIIKALEQQSAILEEDLATEKSKHVAARSVAEATSSKVLLHEEKLKGSEAKTEKLRLDL